MTLIANVISVAERAPIPDWLTRAGIEFLVDRTRRKLNRTSAVTEETFVTDMQQFPVALHTDAANQQHYELPAQFFGLILGPYRKYSCCRYPSPRSSLAEAEKTALEETVINAALADGQEVLELGCGWGSLSLFVAKKFPSSRITAVSNSSSQRDFIEGEVAKRRLTNLKVVTADMNDFAPGKTFDRIVSVEMFEHMSNWNCLLGRAQAWLKADGRLFLHVFTHISRSYRFDHADKADWIAQYFFTGGIMPAHDLIRRFPDYFHVEDEKRWPGTDYERTARQWLENFDAKDAEIREILASTYGKDADLWHRRWRLFFLATSGLFGHDRGRTWGVSHYRMAKA
jgi:cyclopropane-fatty-acyl-phospholipid synthase